MSHYHVCALVIALLHGAAHAAGQISSPSFDCGKASTGVETLICATPHLGVLDVEMSELYEKAIPAPARWHRRLQLKWLAQRDGCSDSACMGALYKSRIEQLGVLKYLDWDNDTAFQGVLNIARNQAALLRAQQAWRRTLDKCADTACIERAYKQRNAALARLSKTVERAGMKKYVNRALGLGFHYLENRTVVACREPGCVQLIGAAMGMGSTFLLEIKVLKGDLEAVAKTIWQREGDGWVAIGRNADPSPVRAYKAGWQGLQASTMCGFHDRTGFHGGGECNTYLRSNGKRAIVVNDDGVSGKDEASMATVASIRFLR